MSAAPIPRPVRRLQAARIVSATALSVLGVRIVADIHAGSFLGAPDVVRTPGNLYCLVVVLAALPIVLGLLAARRWAAIAGGLLLALNVGMAVPVLTYDVQVGGVVLLWNLIVLGQGVFAVKERGPRAPRARRAGDDAWTQRQGPACQHLLLAGLLGGLAVLGYPLAGVVVPGTIALGLGLAAVTLAAPLAYQLLRHRPRPAIALAALVLLWMPAAAANFVSALGLLWVLQAGLLVAVLTRGPVFGDLLKSFYSRPALLILTTFGLLALAGALALTFPAAAADGRPLAFLDALFTAMSATCVTGLIVVDTPVVFSGFGQLVIVALIQLGGLGIMVFSTFAAVLLGGRLALKSEQALEEVLDLSSPGSAYELTRFIVVSTLVIEAIGAAALTATFHREYGLAWSEAAWRGTFHAVSAFCNAGFSLWSDSLIQFQRDALVQGVHAGLIVLGGLGFPVLAALWLRARGGRRRLPLQARIVVAISGALLLVGALLYAVCEWDATLAGLTWGDKLLNAAFQSVSLRTAGFNSVDFAALERSTILMMVVWMFIGASPGSTGGGIKTTTLAVVLAAIPALIRDQPRATLMRRTMPHDVVYRAATIMTIATLVAIVVTFALLASHDMRLETAAFEAVSALATVGLSIGGTAELDAFGKWLIIVTMFIGRVGPVSLALALGTPRTSRVAFPEAKLMVG